MFWRSQDEKSDNVDLANVLNFVSSQINKHTAKSPISTELISRTLFKIKIETKRSPTSLEFVNLLRMN